MKCLITVRFSEGIKSPKCDCLMAQGSTKACLEACFVLWYHCAPKKVGALYFIAALLENDNRNYSKDLKDYLIITSPHQRWIEAELDVRD